MFPYSDPKLAKIKNIFVRQYISDIMFGIGAIRQKEDRKFEIDWDSIHFEDYNILINIALECRVKLENHHFGNKEYCQAGRLFAGYILGEPNKISDEYICTSDLKTIHSIFLAFSPMKISYKVFHNVVIEH